MESKKKNKGGRPKKVFNPAWCDKLIQHMAKGFSFEAFAGVVKMSKGTLYQLTERHAEFLDAKKIGEGLSLLFWEGIGIKGAQGKLPYFNNGAWVFNMKNRFGWKNVNDHNLNVNSFADLFKDDDTSGIQEEM